MRRSSSWTSGIKASKAFSSPSLQARNRTVTSWFKPSVFYRFAMTVSAAIFRLYGWPHAWNERRCPMKTAPDYAPCALFVHAHRVFDTPASALARAGCSYVSGGRVTMGLTTSIATMAGT